MSRLSRRRRTIASVVVAALVVQAMVVGLLLREVSDLTGDLDTTRSAHDASERELDAVTERLRQTENTVGLLGREADFAQDRSLDVAEVVDKASPSVVTISCGNVIGSGFVLDTAPPKGYRSTIVTNHHVVQGCTDGSPSARVTRDGDRISAKLAEWDRDYDLAVLYSTTEIPGLTQGAVPALGDPVVAIGSPYGIEGTVTTGIVTNIYEDAFQTGAAINPGNSGGPLLDRYGDVIGINTAKLQDAEGVNFAIRMRMLCEDIFDGDCDYTT